MIATRPVPTSDCATRFDPAKTHHRAWLQEVLDRLVALPLVKEFAAGLCQCGATRHPSWMWP